MKETTTAVLLAAGAGTRLGRGPKALLPFHGRPLIEHQVRVLRDGGCDSVLAVLGAGSADVLAAARLQDAVTVLNPDWQDGLGTSYRCGVAAALDRSPGAVLVALVDQPGVTRAIVARLLAAAAPGRITAAGYRDGKSGNLRRGHPVVFDAPLAARSLAAPGDGGTPGGDTAGSGTPDGGTSGSDTPAGATGNKTADAGARAFLAANPELVDVIDCSDSGHGGDIDTEADLVLLD